MILEPPRDEDPDRSYPPDEVALRQLWEMTLPEFEAAAKRGRIIQATGRPVVGEMFARTPLRMGELNNYGKDNIAHFYVSRRRSVAIGYEEMMADAAVEGRV